MAKVLAVFGATGNQGRSVVDYVLADAQLSEKYAVRAITRDVNSDKAKELKQKGAQVVKGDIADPASLRTALAGVHTVFIMTPLTVGPDALEVEYKHATTAADIAVENGAQYIIFSTLPSVSKISGGKYTKVPAFDAKAKAEEYIRGLPVQSAFFAPAAFMENFTGGSFLLQRTAPDGETLIVSRHTPATTKVPLIAAGADSGKFVGAILAEPDRYAGRTFAAATAVYSWADITAAASRATGRKMVYEQVGEDEYRASLPPPVADLFMDLFSYYDEFGYYGPGTEEEVAWAAEHARGKLTTLDEYFAAHPRPLV